MPDAALPSGFQASGITCGIKDSGQPDLALFVSDRPATAAGVFTQNRVVGAPVTVSRERVPSKDARAVVINSGNANACTGEQGDADARKMTADVAAAIGCDSKQVLVCSTGIIGVPLPMDIITKGIPDVAQQLSTGNIAFAAAAEAMKTTDTFAKLHSKDVELSTGSVRVSGAGKGAAMIAPNMATMLGVLMTDAEIPSELCDSLLRDAVDQTFNCISVDGHTSTSDTVLMLANGASGAMAEASSDRELLQEAVRFICEQLATDIIRDAEGADHFVTIDVTGFASREDAYRVAKEVGESALVKTAITGNDPNWGRITSAAGYAGVDFDAAFLSLSINDTEVFQAGNPITYDENELSGRMKNSRDISLKLTLCGGPASGSESVRFWTSDLTQEYVRLNSEYTT